MCVYYFFYFIFFFFFANINPKCAILHISVIVIIIVAFFSEFCQKCFSGGLLKDQGQPRFIKKNNELHVCVSCFKF